MTQVKPLEWLEVKGLSGSWWRSNNPFSAFPFEAATIEEREAIEGRYKRRVLSLLEPATPIDESGQSAGFTPT